MRAMEAEIKATMNLPVRPLPLRSHAFCFTSSAGSISQGPSSVTVLVKHRTLTRVAASLWIASHRRCSHVLFQPRKGEARSTAGRHLRGVLR